MTEGRAPDTPRWVKVGGVIAVVVIAAVVILILVQGGHDPRGGHTGGLGTTTMGVLGS